jgi:hypothetical protein
MLRQADRQLPVHHIASDALATHFGFVQVPQTDGLSA